MNYDRGAAAVELVKQMCPQAIKHAWKHKGIVYQFDWQDNFEGVAKRSFRQEVPELPPQLIGRLPEELR